MKGGHGEGSVCVHLFVEKLFPSWYLEVAGQSLLQKNSDLRLKKSLPLACLSSVFHFCLVQRGCFWRVIICLDLILQHMTSSISHSKNSRVCSHIWRCFCKVIAQSRKGLFPLISSATSHYPTVLGIFRWCQKSESKWMCMPSADVSNLVQILFGCLYKEHHDKAVETL